MLLTPPDDVHGVSLTMLYAAAVSANGMWSFDVVLRMAAWAMRVRMLKMTAARGCR